MRPNVNQEQIEGRIYQHNLQTKTVANEKSANFGKVFINGTIDVATDEACLNIVTVHYTFVTELTKNGGTNPSFNNLKRIIESGKTILADGKDQAWKVRLTPSAALNDFYPQGQNELVSQPRHEGGFVSIITELHPEGIERNKFTFDTLITNVEHVEKDEDLGIKEDYAKIHCAIFNFKNDILPFTLTVRNPGGIKYFEDLGASSSEPVFTKVWGKIASETIQVKKETESAFGEAAVDTTQRRVREWVVTGAQKEPYIFGEGGVLTPEDIKTAIENRNIALADIKKRSDEYYASRGTAGTTSATTTSAIPAGGFNF